MKDRQIAPFNNNCVEKAGSARIFVVGGGAWGTALASYLSAQDHSVTLFARDEEVVQSINENCENVSRLAGYKLHPNLRSESLLVLKSKLAEQTTDLLLLSVPAQFLRDVITPLTDLDKLPGVMICAKGIERGSLMLMSELVRSILGKGMPIASLSGPSFAKDVVQGLPTAVTLASDDKTFGALCAEIFASEAFRPYLTQDLIGAEIGGAVKNVLAIACGIAKGKRFGASAQAALITRGFAEMRRLGEAYKVNRDTLHGLCGLGDLILTCSSQTSRNYSFGLLLGEGHTPRSAQESLSGVAEGAQTAEALVKLAKKHNVDMPIAFAVHQILSGRIETAQAIADLLARPIGQEF